MKSLYNKSSLPFLTMEILASIQLCKEFSAFKPCLIKMKVKEVQWPPSHRTKITIKQNNTMFELRATSPKVQGALKLPVKENQKC